MPHRYLDPIPLDVTSDASGHQTDLRQTVRKVPLDAKATALAFLLGGLLNVLGVILAVVVVASWKSLVLIRSC